MIKLSIVVPVFNIEDFLPSCLESILSQNYRDFELILINDGSTDRSGDICDDFAQHNDKVKVFHQDNSGVSKARNFGIEKAIGEWICFVDGDDMIYHGSLSSILNNASVYNSEVIIARSFTYGNREIEKYKFDKSFLNRFFDGYNLVTEKSYKRGSVCGCVFKLDFLKGNKINFPLNLKNGEDTIFISLVHLYAQRVCFVDQKFYLVNERAGSASRSWSIERISNMINNIKFINSYLLINTTLSKEQINILHYSIYQTVSSIFNSLYYCFSTINYLETYNAVQKELKEKLNIGNISLNKEKVRFLNFSLFLFSITVLLNQKIRYIIKK